MYTYKDTHIIQLVASFFRTQSVRCLVGLFAFTISIYCAGCARSFIRFVYIRQFDDDDDHCYYCFAVMLRFRSDLIIEHLICVFGIYRQIITCFVDVVSSFDFLRDRKIVDPFHFFFVDL